MKLRSTIWMLLVAVVLAVTVSQAEDTGVRWSHRELPAYPVLLRRLNIGGHVKLLVTFDSGGHVKQATVRGGNPMLAELSCVAVKRWVRSNAPGDDKPEEIEFIFDPLSGVLLGAE